MKSKKRISQITGDETMTKEKLELGRDLVQEGQTIKLAHLEERKTHFFAFDKEGYAIKAQMHTGWKKLTPEEKAAKEATKQAVRKAKAEARAKEQAKRDAARAKDAAARKEAAKERAAAAALKRVQAHRERLERAQARVAALKAKA